MLWLKKTLNTMRTGVATVSIDRCSSIEGVLAEDSQEGTWSRPRLSTLATALV